MILVAISVVPLAIWAYLLFGRGWFWLCGERDEIAAAANKILERGGRLAQHRRNHSRSR